MTKTNAHETTPSDAAIGPLVAQAYMNLANSIRSGIPTDSGGAIFTSRGMAYIELCLSEMVVALRETRAREIEQGRGEPDLAVRVAEASVALQAAVAARTAAKKARRAEFEKYCNERCMEYVYYPDADQYGVEDKDDACEAAIVAVDAVNAKVIAARGKLRSATTAYLRRSLPPHGESR